MTKAINKILVIRMGPVSEFVMAIQAMQRIRQVHARAHITLLTTPTFEALARSSPFFNNVLQEGAPSGPADLLGLVGMLRSANYDRVYDLQGDHRTNLIFHMLRPFPPEWSGVAAGCKLPHRNPARHEMHTLERLASQLQDAGIWADAPITPGSAPAPDLSWILRKAPQPRPVAGAQPRPYALLVPGGPSGQPGRRWPVERYAELAVTLRHRGLDIVIIGAPEESALARAIQKSVGQARDLTGRTDFAQIAILGAKAALAIGNDSGALHLIAAAGAPTVALFSGSSDPLLSAPRGHVAVIRATSLNDLASRAVIKTALSLLPA